MYGYLIIEKGLPYDPGFKYTLTDTPVILGRSSHQETPDLSFSNWFISRRHCRLESRSGQAELTDLGSKHGTRINNLVIKPEVPVVLQHNDRIVLAQGAVALRYWNWEETCDSTMEITQSALSAAPSQNTTPIRLDVHRHQCFTETRSISLSPKEWNLLLLIYTSRPNPVTLDSIRLAVWPERIIQPATIPEVGVDEINLLVYRLRRKLGKTGSLIVNVRSAGWALKQ